MYLVSNTLDQDERDLVRKGLGEPCAFCGDKSHPTRLLLRLDGQLYVACRDCAVSGAVPETVASHPKYFLGAQFVTEAAAQRVVFSLVLRRHHVAGRVPLRFRDLFVPGRWPTA